MNDSKENRSTGSYVEPRIPSITGFGQRKVNGKPKKVLDYSWEKSNDISGIPKVDVCLRIKPRINCIITGDDTLSILSDNTVACSNGNARDDVTEYTFSSVFGPTVDQKKFFNFWVYDKVLRFLNGNNELLFAYGTTNAGKTYTIHGNPNDPGIIPRTLVLVFNTLNNRVMTQCRYKPDKVIAAHILDECSMRNEEVIRNNILNNWSNEKVQDECKFQTYLSDEGQTLHGMDHLTSDGLKKMFDSLKNDEIPSLDHGDVRYSIWVTYSEIYNETIYDLLASYAANQKRTALKLSLDQNKNVYVRDLTHVFVHSAGEAYKVMSFGKNNLKIASNNLNKLSSRSHCIFTLKLLRLENIENPKTTIISSMSFCDLAGSERLKKTMNVGDRLTESKNINTSLLVLNKCFSVLRENQKRGENHLVPYRESKLTQMFQTALTGNNRTGISMAVNVDMSPNLLEETKQVLFMSAVVRSINRTKFRATAKPRPSFAVWANNHKNISLTKSKQTTRVEDEENLDNSNDEKHTMILTEEDFQVRLNEEQAKIRQELVAKFQKIMENNNIFHKNQKQTMEKNKTEFYENKINRMKAYYLEEIRERDIQLSNLHHNRDVTNTVDNTKNRSEIENYEFQIGELQLQKEEILTQLNELKSVHDLQQEEMNTKNHEIDNYKIMLEEACTEYDRLNDDLNSMTQKVDEIMQEMEEKDLEIERLAGALEAKHDIITEMENNVEELAAESAEKKIDQYMNEKLEIILGLENTIQKLKIDYKKNNEEKSGLAKKYQNLKHHFLTMSKVQEANASDYILLSKMPEKDLKIVSLQKRITDIENESRMYKSMSKELQNTVNVLKTTSIRPETKSVSVLTDLSNVHLPLSFIRSETKSVSVLTDLSNVHLPLSSFSYEPEDKENKLTKSDQRPQRRCKIKTTPVSMKKNTKNSRKDTPDIFEKMVEKAYDSISTSTKKRKLFVNKPPFTDSSNVLTDSTVDSIVSPSHTLHQVTKLRAKK